jgi:hypothetical protein
MPASLMRFLDARQGYLPQGFQESFCCRSRCRTLRIASIQPCELGLVCGQTTAHYELQERQHAQPNRQQPNQSSPREVRGGMPYQ